MSVKRGHASVWLMALLAYPTSALAHGSLPDANAFVNGLPHSFLAPAHAISLAALALLVGGQSQARKGSAMVSLAGGLLIGAVLVGTLGDPNTDALLLALALMCSLLVAFQWPGPRWWTTGLALAVGTAVALGSGDPAFIGVQRLILIGGGCVGALVLAAHIAFVVDELVVRRRFFPAAIAVRIVSSWISAIVLLMLTLTAS